MTTAGNPNPNFNVPLTIYGMFLESLFAGYVDFTDYQVYCMLCTTEYVPNQDTHQFKSDVTGESTGGGYYEGGQDVTGVTALYSATVSGDTTVRLLTVSGGNLVWPDATFSAAYAVLYLNSPVSETLQPLIGYLDFDGTQTPADQAFYINWNADGIFTVTIPNAA